MPKPASAAALTRIVARGLASSALLVAGVHADAQTVRALPDQTSRIRLSNRDINHIVCEGGEIEDVKFSAEKGLAVEKGGSDAWIKFLVRESDDAGQVTRTWVTQPAEFFVTCNGAVYSLYAEPSEVPAQTVILSPGARQHARSNADLLGPLVEEERAVSITLALLDDRVPASFTDVAPQSGMIRLPAAPATILIEHRRLAIEGSGLTASEYRVRAAAPTSLDERAFLDPALGAGLFSLTFDRNHLETGETARLVVIRRGDTQ